MIQRLCQFLFLVLVFRPVVGQTPGEGLPRPVFESFLAKFEPAELPTEIDQPLVDLEAYPVLSDKSLIDAYLQPHGLGTNVQIRTGHVLIRSDQFIGVTVLLILNEDRTWYLATYTPSGEPISRAKVAAHSAFANYSYGHWSTISPDLKIQQSTVTRFIDENGETESCTVRNWTWQLTPAGEIDRSSENGAIEGEECQ